MTTAEPTPQDQAPKLLAHAAGYVGTRTIEIGLERGLIEALARRSEGLTAEDLAAAVDGDPFYTEVWCRAAHAAEVVDHDEASGRYVLQPHLDTLLLDQTSPGHVGALFRVLTEPEVFDRFALHFQSGEHTWWDQVSSAFIEGVAGTGGAFNNRLIPGALSEIDGAVPKLEDGGRVMELACGTGYAIVRLLEHFPEASVVGVDGDAYSLKLASEAVDAAGVGDRVELVESPLEDLDFSEAFDMVTINVSMHECRDIDAVTVNVHRALRPGGLFVISDFPFPADHDGLRTVPGRIMSGIQFFEALIDDQLMATDEFVALLEKHGFEDVGTVDVTPVHAVTYGRR